MENTPIGRLKNVMEGHPWYGTAVLEKLTSIDFQKVNAVPHPKMNSIAKLLQHMINWRWLAIKKMQGEVFEIEIDSELDWPNITIDSQAAWQKQIEELNQTQQILIEMVENANDEFMNSQVLNRQYNVEYLVEGIVQHDIYHLGQIAVIEKLAKLND